MVRGNSTSNHRSNNKTRSVSGIIDVGIVYSRREGSCPLQYGLIREVLGYVHDHLRFILTRHGLGESNEIMPAKLSIYAILNARYMDDFKNVLLGQSFRERTWPIVKSSRAYDDMVPWLQANRCPYMYDAETVKTANDYGIYRYAGGGVYEGEWRSGKYDGKGKYKFGFLFYAGDIYEGGWKDNRKHGQGKYTCANGGVYEGGWKDNNFNGQGKMTYPDGRVYEGGWRDDKRTGFGKETYTDGTVFYGLWKNNVRSDQ